jgi:hypothetical protein
MKIKLIVEVELKKTSGKSAEREELEEILLAVISDADPASIEGEDGGEYEVITWKVIGPSDVALESGSGSS